VLSALAATIRHPSLACSGVSLEETACKQDGGGVVPKAEAVIDFALLALISDRPAKFEHVHQ
jgi:hypothetical protein